MSNEPLKSVIAQAVMAAAQSLFRETGESFYYFALITSGEAHAPTVSAWSREKLSIVPEAERAMRLNPPAALRDWLEEAAE